MKTLKTVIVCLVLAISCVAFVGCDKEKDSDSKGGSNSIVGTWRASDGYSEDIFVFDANGVFQNVYQYDIETSVTRGTYRYNSPYLTLYFEEGESETLYATINGNTLMIEDVIYYRQ